MTLNKPQSLLFWLLFLIETVGVALFIYIGLPLYRTLALDFESFVPGANYKIAIIIIFLVQIPYWIRREYRINPQVPKLFIVYLLATFAARMLFVLAAAIIAVALFLRGADLNVPMSRILIALIVMFAIFCYARDLEVLALRFKPDK